MKICLVSHSFYPATKYGGPISATWDLATKLVKAGESIKVYVSTTNADGSQKLKVPVNQFIEQKKNLFVKYCNTQLKNFFSISFIFGLWNDIKKVDIIYIQYLFHYTVFFSLVYSLINKKRVIICPRGAFSNFTLSNRNILIKKIWLKFLFKPFLKNIEWQASSYLEKDNILNYFPLAQVILINDGIDFSSFQGEVKSVSKCDLVEKYTKVRYNIISHVFFSMGRLHRIKRFDVLIDAFALFVNTHKNAKLLIAGSNDGMEKHLLNRIHNLHLNNSVFLIGHINFNNKKLLLNNCDYFTLASDFESFGIVIAEALSCGRPVIISDKTPWNDIEKNNCGILAKNDKVNFNSAFQDIIQREFDEFTIKNYVKSRYDWNVIIRDFLNLIKN